MQLLNIFHSGLFGWITGIAAILVIIYWYQAFKAHNSEWIRQDQTTGTNVHVADKTPLHKIPQFWIGLSVLAIYIIALFIIGSDYKGL